MKYSPLCCEGVIILQFTLKKMYICNVRLSALHLLSLTMLPSSPITQALIMLYFEGADRGARNPQINSHGITCFHLSFVLSVSV